MWSDRRRGEEHPYAIPCRQCAEPVELDPARIERLAGKPFIECVWCHHLVYVRRTDLRAALRAGGRP